MQWLSILGDNIAILIWVVLFIILFTYATKWFWSLGGDGMPKKGEVVAASNVFLEDELQSAANRLKRPVDRVKAALGESNGILLLCLSDKEVLGMVEWGVKGKNTMVSLKPAKVRLSGTQISVDAIPVLTKRGKKVG